MSIPPDFTRRVQEHPQIAVLIEAASKVIEMNRQHAEDQYGDANKAESWACVRILREAIAKVKATDLAHTHAHYAHELALDAAARTGETPLAEHLPGVPGME
jgi:hypothetical protein